MVIILKRIRKLLCLLFVMVFTLSGLLEHTVWTYAAFSCVDIVDATTDKTEIEIVEVMSDYINNTHDTSTDEVLVDLGITAKSVLLMEAETKTVIYEQNADEVLSPASITKIMTLILIFDAIEAGRISLQDEVTTSAYAKSMGGSQVFLEEGEKQTVETLIKCIVVASGNDASVAMAEHICGSEAEFVRLMNERAKGLNMTNTNFEDCCGLTESDNHYTTARDVAIMSRELITRYPQIKNYSTIWMENITHVTSKGTSEFGLANTNKLLKQYEWCTGLKTGSTSKAKYCLSATAYKNGVELIAVVMAAPDYKVRFKEAMTLLNYGYGICNLYTDENTDILPEVKVNSGKAVDITIKYKDEFTYLDVQGKDLSTITKEIVLPENGVSAPVKAGDVIGKANYYMGEELIGSIDIVAVDSVDKASYFDCIKRIIDEFAL